MKKTKGAELVFYGETLDSPKLLKKECDIFLRWFFEEQRQRPELTVDNAIREFAQTRPWGKPRQTVVSDMKASTVASDMKALAFAFLSFFDAPTPPSYSDEISKTDVGRRLRLFQEYQTMYAPKDKNVSLNKIIRLINEWNIYGKEYESLITSRPTPAKFEAFYNRIEATYKQLLATFGTKICAAHRCMNPLPANRRPEKKYCSPTCRNRAKQNRWGDFHVVEKKRRRP